MNAQSFISKQPVKQNSFCRSPKLKRPKLDFIEKYDNLKGPSCTEKAQTSHKVKNQGYILPEWDDDCSGELLEEVMLKVESSQAYEDGKAVSKVFPRNSSNEENIVPGVVHSKNISLPSCNLELEINKLREENERLKEQYKTKEGESHILRSQLQQVQDAKLAESFHNSRVTDEMRKKFQEKISFTEKELENMKTKVEFQDLEIKKLTEKCKQLEVNKVKLVEPQPVYQRGNSRKRFSSSQAVSSTQKVRENENAKQENIKNEEPECCIINVENKVTDGSYLSSLLCPEYFELSEEPNIIQFYSNPKKSSCHVSRLDFDKREKYIWSDLPKQSVFIKDTFGEVSYLMLCSNWETVVCKKIVLDVLKKCRTILGFQRDLLQFLVNTQNSSFDFDDPDQQLLENEDAFDIIGLKEIISIKMLNKEECGTEGRRCLGLILAFIKVSRYILSILIEDIDYLKIFHDIVKLVGDLRRPVRYSGLLIGITFIFNEILKKKDIKDEVVCLVQRIIEEIIFCRPKLNVIRELIILLQTASQNSDLSDSLCRNCLIESSSLFMNSKLQQAMFFTKDACPLQLLFTQITGLASLPSSIPIRTEVTKQLLKWVNFTKDKAKSVKQNWLQNLVTSDKQCFALNECMTYMLSLCVYDFNTACKSNFQNGKYLPSVNKINAFHFNDPQTVIGSGISLLKWNVLLDPALFENKKYNLLFALSLKNIKFSEKEQSFYTDCLEWITNMLESNKQKQINSEKQNFSKKKFKLNEDELLASLCVTCETIFN